jgi:hypothetical protein
MRSGLHHEAAESDMLLIMLGVRTGR